MKHQISIRRMFCHIALLAVGMALIRFAFTSQNLPHLQSVALLFGNMAMSLAICRPVGYLMGGRIGEVNATFVAIWIALIGLCVSGAILAPFEAIVN